MSCDASGPYRLNFDTDALVANWRKLDRLSGRASAGAAVKADGYGLGAVQVAEHLQRAGCRDFFVATWDEARRLADTIAPERISVLNGVQDADMPLALSCGARPTLNSLQQAERWRDTGRPCDIMINSGMNRLGITPGEAITFDWTGFDVDILMSHLASADEDVAQNTEQLVAFLSVLEHVPGRRRSLANSAGIMLGSDYHFDCTRPGLSLYGGIPRADIAEHIAQVVFPQAQILQRNTIQAGQPIGYNATFRPEEEMEVAIVGMGYADGFSRLFSNNAAFAHGGQALPVVGRVSMDLVSLDMRAAPEPGEGDWVDIPFDLPTLAHQSGLSQYELLTGLSRRAVRQWSVSI